MVLHRVLLVLKMLSVMTYAGGLLATFLAGELEARKRAVHRVASPALVVTWMLGYALTQVTGVRLVEAWIAPAFVLSMASNFVLVYAATRDKRTPAWFAAAALPIALVVVLMVFRPTWASLFS
jgi:hypothetical protein